MEDFTVRIDLKKDEPKIKFITILDKDYKKNKKFVTLKIFIDQQNKKYITLNSSTRGLTDEKMVELCTEIPKILDLDNNSENLFITNILLLKSFSMNAGCSIENFNKLENGSIYKEGKKIEGYNYKPTEEIGIFKETLPIDPNKIDDLPPTKLAKLDLLGIDLEELNDSSVEQKKVNDLINNDKIEISTIDWHVKLTNIGSGILCGYFLEDNKKNITINSENKDLKIFKEVIRKASKKDNRSDIEKLIKDSPEFKNIIGSNEESICGIFVAAYDNADNKKAIHVIPVGNYSIENEPISINMTIGKGDKASKYSWFLPQEELYIYKDGIPAKLEKDSDAYKKLINKVDLPIEKNIIKKEDSGKQENQLAIEKENAKLLDFDEDFLKQNIKELENDVKSLKKIKEELTGLAKELQTNKIEIKDRLKLLNIIKSLNKDKEKKYDLTKIKEELKKCKNTKEKVSFINRQ